MRKTKIFTKTTLTNSNLLVCQKVKNKFPTIGAKKITPGFSTWSHKTLLNLCFYPIDWSKNSATPV